MKLKILGYFIDRGKNKENASPEDVFLVYENSRGDMNYLEGYCPIGQHFELKDEKYLDECLRITSKEYEKLTAGYYTPSEYVK